MPRRAALQVVPDADVPDDGRLADIADQVRQLHAAARVAQAFAFEAHLAIGRLLLEARVRLRADRAYGAWLRAQDFPFNRQWAWVLAQAARQEPRVRAAVASQLATGSVPNIEEAVAVVRGRARGAYGYVPAAPDAFGLELDIMSLLDVMDSLARVPPAVTAEYIAVGGAGGWMRRKLPPMPSDARYLGRMSLARRLRLQQSWAQAVADQLGRLAYMADVEQLPLAWSVDPAGPGLEDE